MMRIRARLDTDESLTLAEMRTDVLGPLEANLAKVRSLDKAQWGEYQQEYDALLARTRERMRHVQEADLAWQTAQDSIQGEAWEDAIAALERGLSIARGYRREEIQRQHESVKPKAEVQRQWREALEAGKRNLAMRRFGNAIDAFTNALRLNAPSDEIQPFLAAARAGQCLERAREIMVTDPHRAEQLLKEALRLAADFEAAQELKKEAQSDLAQLARRQEQAARIAQLMGVSPYRPSSGGTPDHLFVGRELEICTVAESCIDSSSAIIGGGRIGKTS